MTKHEPDVDEAARLWAIRLQDAAFDDWDGFTEWLERHRSHLPAYEAALESDAWVEDLLRDRLLAEEPAHRAIVVEQPARRRRWYAAGGAIAASLAAVAAFTVLQQGRPHEIVTAAGEKRTVPLADGSRVILNGGTRILVDRDNPRRVELASGEALFEVRHDARDPFEVMVGGTRLLDAGTVFNVVSDSGALDVAVAEGAVIYQPGRREIRLLPGDALSRTAEGAKPVVRKTSPQAVRDWQQGQLEYNDAPLDEVARDLSRNLGQTVRAAHGAERLRFTGTLIVDGPPDEVLDRAGPLLGVDFVRTDNAWRMTPAHGASPY